MPDRGANSPKSAGGGLAAIVIVAVAGFIFVAHTLRLDPAYAGLLYFWYWAVVKDADLRAMPSSLLGALLGVATAALLQLAARSHQPIEIIGVLLLITTAIVADVMKLIPFAINACFMLFLTIGCAPLIQGHENFLPVIEAILLSAAYFGIIVRLLGRVQRRNESR